MKHPHQLSNLYPKTADMLQFFKTVHGFSESINFVIFSCFRLWRLHLNPLKQSMILNIKFYVIYAPLLIAMSQIKKMQKTKKFLGYFRSRKKNFRSKTEKR